MNSLKPKVYLLAFVFLFINLLISEENYKDRVEVKGKGNVVGNIISETVNGIEIRIGDERDFLKQEDVVRVEYDKVPEQYKAGVNFIASADWDKAISSLNEALSLVDANKTRDIFRQHIYFHLIIGYYNKGDLSNAYDYLKKLIGKYNKSVYLIKLMPYCVAIAKDKEFTYKVQIEFESIKRNILSSVDNPEVKASCELYSAKIYEIQEKYQQAKENYTKVLNNSLVSTSVRNEAKLGVAKITLAEGNIDGAIEMFKELTKDEKSSNYLLASSWNGLGEAYIKKAEMEKKEEERYKLYKSALFSFLRTYILYYPKGNDPNDEYIKSMYFTGLCFGEIAKFIKDQKVKQQNLKRQEYHFNELRGKFPDSIWAKKIK